MSSTIMRLVFLIMLAGSVFAKRHVHSGRVSHASPAGIDAALWQAEDLAEPSESEMMNEEEGSEPAATIPLRRESVPVKRKGKVVSFKTSYSGVISFGSPAQPFRVVFDTGSGHLILPSVECASEACKLHKQYNQSASETAIPINQDGSIVRPGQMCDQVDIGFGTGKIKGEFVQDLLCLGNVSDDHDLAGGCVTIWGVMAVEMSTLPFKTFGFDGILGMGLPTLALSDRFSFLDILSKGRRVQQKYVGVFLTDGEDGLESEMAIGGYNTDRLLAPVSWSGVVSPELGYWQVKILALRIGGHTLDVCKDGSCRGVVDTGTSHLGIPSPFDREVAKMLTTPAGEIMDCRLADLPELEIELPGITITLHPDTYMRRLPLREDVNVEPSKGVMMPSKKELEKSELHTTTTTTAIVLTEKDAPGAVERFCRPRLMPVNMPPPIGPKLFILGEPVLHRYYTVFDWKGPRIGMSVAKTKRNMIDRSQITDRIGSLPDEMDVYLMQQSANSSHRSERMDDANKLKLMQDTDDTDRFIAVQVVVQVQYVGQRQA